MNETKATHMNEKRKARAKDMFMYSIIIDSRYIGSNKNIHLITRTMLSVNIGHYLLWGTLLLWSSVIRMTYLGVGVWVKFDEF